MNKQKIKHWLISLTASTKSQRGEVSPTGKSFMFHKNRLGPRTEPCIPLAQMLILFHQQWLPVFCQRESSQSISWLFQICHNYELCYELWLALSGTLQKSMVSTYLGILFWGLQTPHPQIPATGTHRICLSESHAAADKGSGVLPHIPWWCWLPRLKELARYTGEGDGPVIFRHVSFPFLEHGCDVGRFPVLWYSALVL